MSPCLLSQETNGHTAGSGRVITYGALDGQGQEAEFAADFSQAGQPEYHQPVPAPVPATNPYSQHVDYTQVRWTLAVSTSITLR